MSEPNTILELERLWRGLVATHDKDTFLEHLRTLKRLKQGLVKTDMDGRTVEWLSRIDHVVFRRTRRGVHSFQASGPGAIARLALLCLPWPFLTGLVVGLFLVLTGHARGWELGLVALLALYVARLGHELGHVFSGAPVFYLRGLYTSRSFIEVRLEVGVRAASVSPGQLIRLYLGGCLANLGLGLVGSLAVFGGVWTGGLALSFLGANLALGLGNLLPLRGLGTDGYNAYRTWQASRLSGARAF